MLQQALQYIPSEFRATIITTSSMKFPIYEMLQNAAFKNECNKEEMKKKSVKQPI